MFIYVCMYVFTYPYVVWPRYEPKASREGKATPWAISNSAFFVRPGGGFDNDRNFDWSTYVFLLWVDLYMNSFVGRSVS